MLFKTSDHLITSVCCNPRNGLPGKESLSLDNLSAPQSDVFVALTFLSLFLSVLVSPLVLTKRLLCGQLLHCGQALLPLPCGHALPPVRRGQQCSLRLRRMLRPLGLALLVGSGALLLSACASKDELPEHEVLVTDPVSFEVSGISGELLTNVNAHINSMAVISRKRVFFYRREIQEVVTKGLRAFGYYHPEIKIIMPERNNEKDRLVKIVVDKGKPLFIRNCNMEILGEGARYKVFKELLAQSTLASYQILNHGAYENLKSQISQTAMSLGFFDGKFTAKRIMVYQDQNFADIDLTFDTGVRYRFGELLMSDDTKKLFLPSRSLQKFKEGDKFSTRKINNFISSLNQTGYYNSVDIRPATDLIDRVNHLVPIEMNLERRPYNNMRLGGGFSTDEGPRILLEWNRPLLNDRGDSLGTLMTLTPLTQDAQFFYKIPRKNPNLDYYTLNAIQTHTDMNDTLSDRSHIAAHYIANETGVWHRDYSIRAEYEDFSQGSETGHQFNIIPDIRLTRRESSGGFDPARGYSLSLEALGSTVLWGDSSFVQLRATYRGITSITDNTRFLFRLDQGVNLGPNADSVPPSLRFFAGGDNSIRGFGYRDKAPMQPDGSGLKGAKYLTTGTAEFQFPIGIASSRLAVFLDGGVATDDYQDDILWGPGIGYRFLSAYGIVRVDFAVGLQQGEENSYHLHFAFGPEF